jgi:hypothetical protein
VLLAPIRQDIVQTVHTSLRKNRRQPYAVSDWAGHQHSAEVRVRAPQCEHGLMRACAVLGNGPCRRSYPACLGLGYLPCRPGCLRQLVP